MNRIKELRVAAQMSQAQLGAALGCVGQTVSKLETETRQLDPAMIHALCDLFNCSADYLLCRSDRPKPPELSGEDAELLRAYHAADPDLQALILRSLGVQDARSKPA